MKKKKKIWLIVIAIVIFLAIVVSLILFTNKDHNLICIKTDTKGSSVATITYDYTLTKDKTLIINENIKLTFEDPKEQENYEKIIVPMFYKFNVKKDGNNIIISNEETREDNKDFDLKDMKLEQESNGFICEYN